MPARLLWLQSLHRYPDHWIVPVVVKEMGFVPAWTVAVVIGAKLPLAPKLITNSCLTLLFPENCAPNHRRVWRSGATTEHTDVASDT